MATIKSIFVTKLYREEFNSAADKRLLADVERAARHIAQEDNAGHLWAEANGYPGYTSYASLNDLPGRDPAFADLETALQSHITAFAKELDLDMCGRPLELDSLWVNVLPPGGFHTAHIHPHSVISGTLYVVVPKGASALKLEDPRLAMMMAAPPRKAKAREENRSFVSAEPKVGTLLLWESWLRHEVPVNRAKSERLSVSFNYRWG
jgi:uncharacterized protein (TIGR02466 family)